MRERSLGRARQSGEETSARALFRLGPSFVISIWAALRLPAGSYSDRTASCQVGLGLKKLRHPLSMGANILEFNDTVHSVVCDVSVAPVVINLENLTAQSSKILIEVGFAYTCS